MKRTLLLLIFGIGFGMMGWGQVSLPHLEAFNYTVGQALQVQTGWTAVNTGDDILISSGNLTYSGLVASSGNKIAFDAAGIDAYKAFTSQSTNTVYFSFILNVTALSSLNATGGYFAGLATNSTTFGATIWTGLDATGYKIGINPRTSTTTNMVWVSGTQTLNNSVFIVASYQFVSGTGNDIVNIWVNPSSSTFGGETQPSVSASVTNTSGTDLTSVAQLFIRQDSNTETPFIEIDEIRVGTSWAEVTPIGGTTSPTVTTQSVTSIGTTTATGNGNITNTGGVDPTERGFCWVLATDPTDPDISDSHSTESGTFGIGTFTGNIDGLTAGTEYKVRAYATNSVGKGTSYGNVVTFTTLSNEPSNHPSSFTASANSQTQIDLAFSAASTIENCAGYLILQRTGAAPTGAPADANGYIVGNVIGDGTVAAIITNTADVSKSITGLTSGTHYFFKLFPYNWDGVNASTYNYKTDGTVPEADATTYNPLDATSEVSGPALTGQPDPVGISSLVDSDAEAVRVFDMDIYDYGADGQPTKITQVTIKAGSNNTANWTNTIQGVKLSINGGTSFVTIDTPTIGASSIVIPVVSGNLNIPDVGAETLSMYVYLKSSGLTDNQILEFKVDATAASHGFTADATGSTFLATFATAPVSNQMLTDVDATKLNFVQQPSNTLPNVAMTPAVTVEAIDANNNRDLDYSTAITMTSSGTLSESPVTGSLAAGLATFSTLTHTATGNNLQLTASSGTFTSAVSNPFSISTLLLEENFSYTVGTALTANGWAVTGTSTTPVITVSSKSILYSGYLSSDIGEEITLATSGQDVNRTFASQTSGTVYASCLVNISAASTTGDYFFHLGASTIGTTYHGRVFIKSDGSSNLAFGISRAGALATAVFTPFSYALNTTYLLVLKYTIVAGVTNDVAAIYINPILNFVEPVTGWITSTDTPADLANIGSVALRQGSSSSAPALKFDGIRVSTSWADIVGVTPTFTGTGNWTETARWNTGVVPGTSANPLIEGVATISTAIEVANLQINNTALLTISNEGSLTVSGTLTNSGDETNLIIQSDATGTGSLICNQSVLATVKRYLTQNYYHYIASPVTAQVISPEFINTSGTVASQSDIDLFKWDETTNTWDNIKQDETNWDPAFGANFAVARGYVYANRASDVTKNFTGAINVADQTINLTVTPDKSNGWNIVGNPFSSTMAANSGALATDNLIDANAALFADGGYSALYFWDESISDYVPVNNVSGAYYVNPGQAFMIKAKTHNSAFAFNANMRKHGTSAFYKSTNSDDYNRFNLAITGPLGDYNEALIGFVPGTSTGLDQGFDAIKRKGNANIALYSKLVNGSAGDFAIQALPQSSANEVVAISLDANKTGTYIFKAGAADNMEYFTIKLEDRLTGTFTTLEGNAQYSFAVLTAGKIENRFFLHFKSSVGIEDPAATEKAIYSSGHNLYFETSGNASLDIFNLTGQKIESRQITTGGLHTISIHAPTGWYIVKLITAGGVKSEKIFIN